MAFRGKVVCVTRESTSCDYITFMVYGDVIFISIYSMILYRINY